MIPSSSPRSALGLGVLIDLVPNHVARSYASVVMPATDAPRQLGLMLGSDDYRRLDWGLAGGSAADLAWRLDGKGPDNGDWKAVVAITRGGMAPAMIVAACRVVAATTSLFYIVNDSGTAMVVGVLERESDELVSVRRELVQYLWRSLG